LWSHAVDFGCLAKISYCDGGKKEEGSMTRIEQDEGEEETRVSSREESGGEKDCGFRYD
jgi:hypothetical protein